MEEKEKFLYERRAAFEKYNRTQLVPMAVGDIIFYITLFPLVSWRDSHALRESWEELVRTCHYNYMVPPTALLYDKFFEMLVFDYEELYCSESFVNANQIGLAHKIVALMEWEEHDACLQKFGHVVNKQKRRDIYFNQGKTWVVSNRLKIEHQNNRRPWCEMAANYGWYTKQKTGHRPHSKQLIEDGWYVWQPLSTAHNFYHVDASQMVPMLIDQVCTLVTEKNGEVKLSHVNTWDVYQDPKHSDLISHEGPIRPEVVNFLTNYSGEARLCKTLLSKD